MGERNRMVPLCRLKSDVIDFFFFFSSRRRHTRLQGDWSSDVCSSDLVLVVEACGFGYAFHRQLRELGVEAFVVATEMLNRKRKTNRRDAGKLLDQLYDFDVNGHKKALRPIRVPTLQEQKSRRLCRMRSQLIKVRNILEGQGRGLMFDFDFHAVPQGWWGARKWPKLRAKLLEHDRWLIAMLEHHQSLLI